MTRPGGIAATQANTLLAKDAPPPGAVDVIPPFP
jgi:hypothetical protein